MRWGRRFGMTCSSPPSLALPATTAARAVSSWLRLTSSGMPPRRCGAMPCWAPRRPPSPPSLSWRKTGCGRRTCRGLSWMRSSSAARRRGSCRRTALALARAAKRRGKWVHVGRVNSQRRLRHFWGWADSVDGTGCWRTKMFRRMMRGMAEMEHGRRNTEYGKQNTEYGAPERAGQGRG